MKQLPTVFTRNRNVFRQVYRTSTIAIYDRFFLNASHTGSGSYNGTEVIKVEVRPKGTPLPGGAVEADDREVYPSAHQFGTNGFYYQSREEAVKAVTVKFPEIDPSTIRFNASYIPIQSTITETVENDATEETKDAPRKVPSQRPVKEPSNASSVTFPTGDFTTTEFAAHNNLQYITASQILRSLVGTKVTITGKRPCGGRGKPSTLYSYMY